MPEIIEYYDSSVTANITGVTAKQLRYWVDTGIIEPAREEGEGHGKRYFFDFLNLISIRTVVALRQKALSLQRIRKAISVLEEEFQIKRPLENLSLFTDGQTVFVIGDNPKLVFDVLRRGQAVFAIAIDEIIDDLSKRLNISLHDISTNWNNFLWSTRSSAQ
ncbi:MAG: MerR family transcriptional regulator [Bacillota bacterium]